MLAHGEAVIAFPEGVRGMNKLFSERYQLQRFGLGFMRLALATQTPIVPVAVVGSEEQAPAIANLRGLARVFGMPAWHPFIVLCQWAEDTAYRDADVVVSMLPKVHAYMASRAVMVV